MSHPTQLFQCDAYFYASHSRSIAIVVVAVILDAMGFNPTRKRIARSTDIWFVIAALSVASALVAWAFFG